MTPDNPSPQVITPLPVQLRLSPHAFHRWAEEFLEAAEVLPAPESYTPVPYFLYCRSLELAFKARLLEQGVEMVTLKDGRKVGHDLLKAHNRLYPESSARLCGDDLRLLQEVNEIYPAKRFEYWSPVDALRAYPRPSLESLAALARKVLDAGEHLRL